MTALAGLTTRPLETVSGDAPGGQALTAVRVPGARTAEMRVVVALPRASDAEAAHADVLGHCLLAAPDVQERLGTLGTDASAGADPRRLTVAASATLEGWTGTLAALTAVLADPDPTPDAVGLACGATARGALLALMHPGHLARSAVHHLIWGHGAPSRFDVPSSAALGEVSAGSLRRFAHHRLGTAPAHVVVGGPDPAAETWDRAAAALTGWTTSATPPAVAPLPRRGPFARTLVGGGAPGRSRLRLAMPSPARHEPGYAAARLSAAVLAGGPASRLYRRLRDELGLVYSVNHATETVAGEVLDIVDVDLRTADVEEAVAALADALTAPPTEEEVERVRRRVLGSQLVARSSLAATVGALADLRAEGLDQAWSDRYTAALAHVPVVEVQADAVSRVRPERSWSALVTDHPQPTPNGGPE